MKKGVCLIIFLVLWLMIIIVETIIVTGEITGETVTGEATAQVAMNISVISTNPPTLTINRPKNETYFANTSLRLQLDFSGAVSVWYRLDNGINITFTEEELDHERTTFNTSEGGHIIYVFANNSNGITSKNVTFSVDLDSFNYSYGEYEGSCKGQSTYFGNLSCTEIQNISDFILENTNCGKILFNEAINLTDDLDPTDNTLDINAYVNISSNRIEINSTALPNFNKSATLWLYNLSFPNPRILRDGSVCPSNICIQESYTGGTLKTLKFNVTGFTVYSAEETPSLPEEETPTISGGGGVRGRGIEKDFYVEQNLVKVMVKQGESFKTSINIKNTENIAQNFQLSLSPSLEGLVFLFNNSFSLEAGEEKQVYLTFVSTDKTIPDVYTGNLELKTQYITKKIPIILNIKSKVVLFDVSLDIPTNYKEVFPGGEVLLQLTLFNLGEIGKVDISVEYIIKDFEGNIILKQTEIIAVETQASLSKIKKLPQDIKPGQYVAIVQARYDASIGSSTAIFYVIKEELEIIKLIKNKYFIIVLFIFALTLLLVILLKYEKKKIKALTKKQVRGVIRKPKLSRIGEIRETFRRQLEALEQAYFSRYISREAYIKGKKRIKKQASNID